MQNSSFDTYTVQPIGSENPTTLAKGAKDVPMRVLIENVGPVVIFVSAETTNLQPLPTTASYRVFPGRQEAFVIAPKQGLYAVGVGVGGLMSVATSAALPVP